MVEPFQKRLKSVFTKLRNKDNKIDSVTLILLSGIADDMRKQIKQKVLKPNLPKSVSAWATKKHTKIYQ